MNFLDPDMLSFFVWVIILCTSAILLFGVIFIILQARDHRILCWKEKRHLDEGKGKYNGVKSVSEGKKERDHLNVVVRNVHYRHDDNDFMLNRPLPPLPVSHHAVSHHTRHYHPFRTQLVSPSEHCMFMFQCSHLSAEIKPYCQERFSFVDQCDAKKKKIIVLSDLSLQNKHSFQVFSHVLNSERAPCERRRFFILAQ